MKKQNKTKNLVVSLQSLGIIFLMLFMTAFACGDENNGESNSPGSQKNSNAKIYGVWVYAQGESEGSTTSVSGDLKLNSDGTFEDTRYIGGILGYRKGTFRVSGEQLILTDEKSGDSQSFTFYIGAAKDGDNEQFTALTLKGNGISYLLTKK